MEESNVFIEAALSYAARGWSVIPLRAKDKKPAIASWKEYQTRRATEEEIRAWWERWPQANVGLITGAISGVIVLDVDGDAGRESLTPLLLPEGMPRTPYTNTGKGHHYLFRHPGGEWRNFAGKLPGLDFRGDGGYIVAPPSVHPSGRQYEWALSPEEAELADPPAWLMDLLTKKSEPATAPPAKKPEREFVPGAGAEVILANCAFCQHCRDNAATLSEPEWYAMISNLARAKGGDELIHELSRPYPGYSPTETDKKIDHALQDGEPHTCQYIQDSLGFTGCPAGGCGVKAPIGFVTSPVMSAKLTVSASITRLETNQDPTEVYGDQEIIGALAVLKKNEPAEYAASKRRMKEVCEKINLNDLERVVNKKIAENQKLRIVDSNEPPPKLADFLPDMPNTELRKPFAWTLNENGIWQETRFGPVCACSVPVLLTKRLHNVDTGEEKVQLSFYRDGSWKHIVANRSTVFNRSSIVSLGDRGGLPVSSETAKHLVRYLTDFERENMNLLPLSRSVSRMGWVGSRTFLPGAEGDIELDVDAGGTTSIAAGYRQEGTLEEWVKFIEPIRQFPIARFTLAASFAAPLLKIINQRVFIVHNWGPSRGGKTASLKAALSVWGEPEEIMASFNATKVGLERLAAFYSDLPLGIDERQVVGDKQKFVESLVYLLGLGKGKARGAKGGGLQNFTFWRTIALTTGEEPLSTDSSTAGIKTRSLELYGVPIPNEKLAGQIHQGIDRNYGVAGPVFIKHVLAELENDPDVFKNDYDAIQEVLTDLGKDNMSSHVAAVATVCMADYYASKWVFGLNDAEAYDQAMSLAQSIIGQLETATEADDGKRAYEQFIDWVNEKQNYFVDGNTIDFYGWFEAEYINVIGSRFDKTMRDNGFTPKRILKDWAERGWIQTSKEGDRVQFRVSKYCSSKGKSIRVVSVKKDAFLPKDSMCEMCEEM